jgi:DNA-binding response OmpR family regulator
MNVLLIEDDPQLNSTISNFLILSGYSVTSLLDGEDALLQIDTSNFDLFILDINVPNVDGLELLKYIRQKDLLTPIIIITASLELENFKTAFNSGCNEYIKKPFYLEELGIRIKNLLEKKAENSLIQISDNITYDMEYEELKIDDQIIKLRKKERRLLTILLQNINKTVSTEVIENYVWENEIKEVYPLRQLLSDLRKKLSTDEKFIFAEKGLGYRFEIKK